MIKMNNIMASVSLLVASCFLMSGSFAAEPKWSFEFSAGVFEPVDENWSTYYGSQKMPEISVAFARRFFSVIDLGVAMNYGVDKGTGRLPISELKGGSVRYHIVPVDIFLLYRARFSEEQWLVPYFGGGYTRFNYRQEISGQGKVQGGTNGHHLRAGLQILLDPLERKSAQAIYQDYGELGGLSYKVGLLLEF